MKKYVIDGGKKLEGTTYVSGSKNASLPIIAATILNGGINKLYNVPDIHDTKMMFRILETLGCKIKKNNGKIIIDSRNITNYEIPENLMSKMRSSVIIAGALLSRKKKVVFTYPGGCDIGSRPIDLHIKSFEKLGVNVKEELGDIKCEADKIKFGILMTSPDITKNAHCQGSFWPIPSSPIKTHIFYIKFPQVLLSR